MCHYRWAIPVTSLLPWTFANFHQLVNPKRCWGLIPEPDDQPVVYGLCLSVPHRLGSLFLTAFECSITWQGLFSSVGSSRRAKRGDGDSSSTGWGTRSEHLKIHISELLSIWPNPIYRIKKDLRLAVKFNWADDLGILFSHYLYTNNWWVYIFWKPQYSDKHEQTMSECEIMTDWNRAERKAAHDKTKVKGHLQWKQTGIKHNKT